MAYQRRFTMNQFLVDYRQVCASHHFEFATQNGAQDEASGGASQLARIERLFREPVESEEDIHIELADPDDVQGVSRYLIKLFGTNDFATRCGIVMSSTDANSFKLMLLSLASFQKPEVAVPSTSLVKQLYSRQTEMFTVSLWLFFSLTHKHFALEHSLTYSHTQTHTHTHTHTLSLSLTHQQFTLTRTCSAPATCCWSRTRTDWTR